ncbi:MAG: transposase [Bacteroidales bacterium]
MEGRENTLVQEIREQATLNIESLNYLEGRICEFLDLEADFGTSLNGNHVQNKRINLQKEPSAHFKENSALPQKKEVDLSLQTELEAEYEINKEAGLEAEDDIQQELKRRIKEKIKLKKENKQVKRIQEGFFHVWFRGCNRYNVFYEERDFIGFLERCKISAEKNKTAITAFVLMNNHVHLQVYTHTLNDFMKSLLISFSQWYNRRKEMDGQVFKSPFSSSPIYSRSSLERNLIYIFTNPVRAGMCSSANDYKWSSFHFAKKNHYNPLKNYIKIETAAVDYLYKSSGSLLKNSDEFLSFSTFNDSGSEKAHKEIKLCKPNDSEVAIYLKYLLNGKSLRELSDKDFVRIIKVLKFNQNASYRQISSLTHESYHHIRQKLSR